MEKLHLADLKAKEAKAKKAKAENGEAGQAAGTPKAKPIQRPLSKLDRELAAAAGGDVLLDLRFVAGGDSAVAYRMAERFVEQVAASERKLIVNISSIMGSIARLQSTGSYFYRASKAALNMVTKGLSIDLAERGITVVAVHPGWVQTDMGGPNAPTSVDESVKGLADVVESAGGGEFRYVDYTGKDLPF